MPYIPEPVEFRATDTYVIEHIKYIPQGQCVSVTPDATFRIRGKGDKKAVITVEHISSHKAREMALMLAELIFGCFSK